MVHIQYAHSVLDECAASFPRDDFLRRSDSGLVRLLYQLVRQRPGLPIGYPWVEEFWQQVRLDRERMPKVRRYLKDRRRRPVLAAARLHLEKLVALPDGSVANVRRRRRQSAEIRQTTAQQCGLFRRQ